MTKLCLRVGTGKAGGGKIDKPGIGRSRAAHSPGPHESGGGGVRALRHKEPVPFLGPLTLPFPTSMSHYSIPSSPHLPSLPHFFSPHLSVPSFCYSSHLPSLLSLSPSPHLPSLHFLTPSSLPPLLIPSTLPPLTTFPFLASHLTPLYTWDPHRDN